jgi:hypothetical protein
LIGSGYKRCKAFSSGLLMFVRLFSLLHVPGPGMVLESAVGCLIVCGFQRALCGGAGPGADVLFDNFGRQTPGNLKFEISNLKFSSSGDCCVVDPPVPIPNTEVKRHSSDGSACLACARVGRCQNSSPGRAQARSRGSFFCVCGGVWRCFGLCAARVLRF